MNTGDPSLDWEQKKIYIKDQISWYRKYLEVNNVCDYTFTINEIK